MRKYQTLSMALIALLCQPLPAETIKTFRDNGELSIELSNSNQNRLMVRNDKIMKVAFPDGAMTYQYDESDGSMYVHPEISAPFTLFLSTKKGKHVSLTINSVDSLGKTIAFNLYQPHPVKKAKTVTKKEAPFKKEVLEMLQYMERGLKMPGVRVRNVRMATGNFNNGLRLIKRETWKGAVYDGETFDVYNSSKQSITLSPSWFSDKNTKAVKLSQTTLAPKAKTKLYLVKEVAHG